MSSQESSLPWIAVAPIHGLFVLDNIVSPDVREGNYPLVKLSDDLEIGQLSAEDQQHLYHIEAIRRVGGSLHSDRYYAVKARYEASGDGNEIHRIQQNINNVIDMMLQVMRVFKDGPVYFGGIAHWVTEPLTRLTNIVPKSWPELPFALYPLDEPLCIAELQELWLAVNSHQVKSQGYMAVAMRWFSRASEVNRYDDRLINLMIAVEALCRKPKGGEGKGCINLHEKYRREDWDRWETCVRCNLCCL